MIIIFATVLVTAVASYPAGQILYSNDLRNSIDEVYGSYLTLSNNQKESNNDKNIHPNAYFNNMIVPPQQMKPADSSKYDSKSPKVERINYFNIKTNRKNKRFASYLTLCHFKICNMGRKRTTRYFDMISSLGDET